MTPECPKCGSDTQTEEVVTGRRREYYCPTCSHSWPVPPTQSPASPQQVPTKSPSSPHRAVGR